MYFDTHTHLNADQFTEIREDIIQESLNEKVTKMVVVGFDEKTNKLANQIVQDYDFLYASAGIHPVDAHEATEDDFKLVEQLLKQDKTVAVGECGLDYYWQKDTKDVQAEVFKRQLRYSREYKKPIIIHTRDAMKDTYDLLKEEFEENGPISGIMHCYSGSPEMAEKFLELGLHISLGGPVTFKNAKMPKEVAKMVPSNRLLIETDCPYLAPHPFRGKLNKPSLVPLVAKEIARLRDTDAYEVAKCTYTNAMTLFNIED
ncbi:TatD family hydrolase [Haloplasma contractile]|uniref:Deoxyribonuclease TatD family protein n=1 Tax=Haloplasma contractile SSD-17B TaxID=1033810 RepID=U2FQP4_9MOLU|nr:TatD family hydrolase [Haloplasma contractile]ERJ13349.1 Deoxyribonuclease TatD family protein [Haloplasma contractile SSD-17B]